MSEVQGVQKVGFGVVDDTSEDLQTKVGGKFGLNQAFPTKFEYNPNGGANDTASDCIDITLQVGQKEFRTRIYDVTGPLFKGNNKVQPDEEGYTALYNAEITQRMAVITHLVKAMGVTDAQIQAALATPATNFADWAKIMTALPGDDAKTKAIDIFLEWEWEIKGDNTQTFLQIPKNMKGGRFLCPAMPGEWKEVRGDKGELKYVNATGAEHPFTKTADFMSSPKAKQQKEGDDEQGPTGFGSGATEEGTASGTPAASSW